MSPDDPRHGTNAGYCAGCHEECCRAAIATWTRDARARRRRSGPLTVSSLGTRRRIQALMALGWSTRHIDERLGKKRTYAAAILTGGDRPIHRNTALAVAVIYERMSMSLPPQTNHRERQIASRSRNYAAKQGWAPPLAWDDIDRDPAPCTSTRSGTSRYDIDHAVVLRVLSGENLPTTRAEKDEVVRRWVSSGRSEKSLCEQLGWKSGRYGKTERDEVA